MFSLKVLKKNQTICESVLLIEQVMAHSLTHIRLKFYFQMEQRKSPVVFQQQHQQHQQQQQQQNHHQQQQQQQQQQQTNTSQKE